MKKTAKMLIFFFVTFCLCASFLFLSSLIPQKNIDKNIASSVVKLVEEGLFCRILDGKSSAMLDNFTDSTIITVTKSTDFKTNPVSFLTNPIIEPGDINEYDPLSNLENYVAGKVNAKGTYVRYWMGFRIFLRPLFSFFDYSQIRIIQLALLLLLGLATALSVWKNTGFMTAVMYGFSILLIRPLVISRSFQFSCCLFIAMIAVLAVPFVKRRLDDMKGFFMVVGMLTMFFDFYTVPVLTFGMPMIYYAAIQSVSQDAVKMRDVISSFLHWAAGYVGMWIAKLFMVEIATDESGFANAFSEFMHWMGPHKETGEQVSAWQALDAVRKVVFESTATNIVMAMFAVCMLAVLLIRIGRKDLSVNAFKKNLPVLFVAALPIAWFCAAANPTKTHTFFQYRSIAATYWAVGAFVTLSSNKIQCDK